MNERVERIKEMYPPGTRIRLGHMEDMQAVPDGTMGTVRMVDDAGQIHMKWDNGRSLSIIPGEDEFEVVPEKENQFGFYTVSDLMMWAVPGEFDTQPEVRHFENLEDAMAHFQTMRELPYNYEPAWNESAGKPYSRLALGIETKDGLSSIDLIHVRAGANYLVDDFRRVAAYREAPGMNDILKALAEEIGIDRIHPYVMRKGQLESGRDIHITEWPFYHDYPIQQKFISFHNILGETMFRIRDGQSINLIQSDGSYTCVPCQHMGDYHLKAGVMTWHIQQFAEMCWYNGRTVLPVHAQPGDNLATYRIYQIPHNRDCGYLFREYDFAKDRLKAADYKCVYQTNLPEAADLNTLDMQHNRDDRPLGQTMRSMSVSDIVVLNRDGKETAYYYDSIGFKELPDFAEELNRQEQPMPVQEQGVVELE